MKYIKTKDGEIYEQGKVFIIKENDVELVLPCINEDFIERTRGKSLNYRTNVIVKKANTIEELCDFIFVKDEYGDYRLYDLRDKNTDKTYLKESLAYGWLKELYYCIKTDKGLIFVTKVNDKGDLELL